MDLNKIDKGIEILEYTIENKVPLKEACIKLGSYESFLRKLRRKININYERGLIDNDIYNNFNNKYEEALNLLKSVKKGGEDDVNIDESFDKRSKWWVERDNEGLITEYLFKILVRDEEPFEGKISRKEMEMIYQYYPYVTRNTISQQFPYFTFPQFKRILRVFNITKDKLFPQHILEENNDEQIAEFALKAKESSSYKKFLELKPNFLEKQLRDTQNRLIQELDNKKWFNQYISDFFDKYDINKKNKYLNQSDGYDTKKDKKVYEGPYLFVIFGDIHFGKYFPTHKVMYGRGNDKDILMERCMEIMRISVDRFNDINSNKLILNCLGDIFESILPDGMHPQHTFEMDLYGHEQMLFAINVFEDMISYFIENTPNMSKLVLHGIGGNHDRLGEKRDQDKTRTATAIFYSILDKIVGYKYNDRVIVVQHDNGIIQFEESGISFIGFHGDSMLMKRKPIELMNMFKVGDNKNYTVMMNGHWHFGQFNEGINYLQIGSGSVCSVDGFIQNELGGGAQPSFILGYKSKGYGFDFERKTLY